MMFKKQVMFLLIVALSALSGCARYYSNEPDDEDLIEVSYGAVDEMLKNLKQPLPRGSLVVINSLVNVDDMGQTLPFGRIVSDQISSAFHRNGYRIMGMELPTEIFEKKDNNGILHLSDATKAALKKVGAQALVIGTYAGGKKHAYVSLRIVDLAGENFIATSDLSTPMGPDAKILLKPKKVELQKKEETPAPVEVKEPEPVKKEMDDIKSEFEPTE